MDSRANIIPVDNETLSSTTRVTADGRTITYQMTVLQQPERARACGQGAKSSADRRPVDPPPIVELQIFQGDKREEEEDITFTMNANYFLFASLEQARPMALGRMPQERSTPPVLTGTPVAGMVYLDRPKPAGYFIFPDLSVRHEGKYRLSFSLYEELKNAKDDDEKVEDGASTSDGAPEPHVTHRLEVKSAPFHVYSAKKFPGLTESTSLSRMVAEQGCRVRIRRDVRMRRRDHKGSSKDWDDYEDETAAQRARASATPDPSMYPPTMHPPPPHHAYMDPIARPQSASNASHHSLSRRTSLPDLNNHAQPSYPAPPTYAANAPPLTPQSSASQSSAFGPSQQQQQQQQQQSQQYHPSTPSASLPQQHSMHPPFAQYSSQSFPAPAPPAPAVNHGFAPAPAPSAAPAIQAPYARSSYDATAQRSSGDHSALPALDLSRSQNSQIPLPPPPPQALYSSQNGPYQPGAPLDSYGRPAPLEPLFPFTRSTSNILPPLSTATMPDQKHEASSPFTTAPPGSYSGSFPAAEESHKRSFGHVFSNRHQDERLSQGARPSATYGHSDNIIAVTAALSAGADDDDSTGGDLDLQTLGMHYRRADGRQIMRALPGSV